MHECGELVLTTGGWHESSWVATRVPARVHALAGMQLASVDEPVRRVVELAGAARATDVSLSELRAEGAALEPRVSDATLSDALDRALQIHLLEERTRGYAFRHRSFARPCTRLCRGIAGTSSTGRSATQTQAGGLAANRQLQRAATVVGGGLSAEVATVVVG
jgi:hypothetical protein